jgi:deaminated glutathione amidase
MRIAVAQFAAGMSKTANLERITELTSRAADMGARLVVFPEGTMCDFGARTDVLHGLAEPLDGRFVHAPSAVGVTYASAGRLLGVASSNP